MIATRTIHSWFSRNLFIPWLVRGPWNRRRYEFRTALSEALAGFQVWNICDPHSRQTWVLNELRAIVRWAAERVPYYRELFSKVGFDPRTDFSFTDYRQLPPLDKDALRSRQTDLVADGFSPSTMMTRATGGSTGVPVHFWLDDRSRAWSTAAEDWMFARVGLRAGDRIGMIWGANVDFQMQQTFKAKVVNWLVHQQTNNCFRLSDNILDQIDSRLAKYQPDFLLCYASALTLLAHRLLERKRSPSYPGSAIITGAEKFDARQRAVCEAVFAVPIYESYGSRDCGIMAMQLDSANQRLHVAGANVLLEPLGDLNLSSGNEILVTILHRWGMPFLRYRIGDRAIFPLHASDGPVETLEEVTGRVLDHLQLPSGQVIHSTQFPHFFKDFDVREYQVVQDSKGNVRVLLVAGPKLTSEDLSYIDRVVKHNLTGVSVTISNVPSIDRTSAGKLRPVVSYYRTSTCLLGESD